MGGGLKINEVEIPQLSQRRMVALAVVGFLFLGTGLVFDQSGAQSVIAAMR
ncbi:hypothetical protein ACH47Z_22930 [Streptomyces sp. NPDC020192]|uniref:hypothetical protein n=1 Tax=Streptomyces sp. NPDC020192 TaxID=3365066 RepID=UPI0037A1D460